MKHGYLYGTSTQVGSVPGGSWDFDPHGGLARQGHVRVGSSWWIYPSNTQDVGPIPQVSF